MTRGAELSFESISWQYDGASIRTLENISFSLSAGETVVLLGASGCGKSTLLRMVNRLLTPKSGKILLDHVDIATVDVTSLRRSIGYVIQSVGLFPHRTVAQNIATVPELLGWSRSDIDARTDEVLRTMRLDPERYRDRKPAALSGGEAQRVGIARAIAARPRLLLMDEPFGALDPRVRHALQVDFSERISEIGTTTLFVTHDIEEALLLADRIVVMEAGRIAQIAQPLDLLQHPVTPSIGEFVGSENLLRRLRFIRVDEVMAKLSLGDEATLFGDDLPEIGPHQDLYTALHYFFMAPEAQNFRVVYEGRTIGKINFALVAQALRDSSSRAAA